MNKPIMPERTKLIYKGSIRLCSNSALIDLLSQIPDNISYENVTLKTYADDDEIYILLNEEVSLPDDEYNSLLQKYQEDTSSYIKFLLSIKIKAKERKILAAKAVKEQKLKQIKQLQKELDDNPNFNPNDNDDQLLP